MNYHLLSDVNKYLYQTPINILCSLDIYNNGIKYTYLYRIPIIKIDNQLITEKTSKKYKYIVTDIKSTEEIDNLIRYDIRVFGIVARGPNINLNNLPKYLKIFRSQSTVPIRAAGTKKIAPAARFSGNPP